MVGGVESPAQGARLPFGPSNAPSRAVAERWKKIARRAQRGKSPPHPLQSPSIRSDRGQSNRGQSYGTGEERNTPRKPK